MGGGLAGLTAALEAAELGHEVAIVEKAGELGGEAARLWKRVPEREPYAEPVATGMEALIARVSRHPRITVHLESTLMRTSGAPGRFVAGSTSRAPRARAG